MQVRAKKNCNALFDRHFSVKKPVRPGGGKVFCLMAASVTGRRRPPSKLRGQLALPVKDSQ